MNPRLTKLVVSITALFSLAILTPVVALTAAPVSAVSDSVRSIEGGDGVRQEERQANGGPTEIRSQTSIGSIQDIPSAILTLLFGFLPGVATLYLILTGYRYIVAQGNQELTEKAKKSLTYAVYGVIIAYASAAIILLFAKALDFRVAL